MTFFNDVMERDVEQTMVERQEIELIPATQTIDEELVSIVSMMVGPVFVILIIQRQLQGDRKRSDLK